MTETLIHASTLSPLGRALLARLQRLRETGEAPAPHNAYELFLARLKEFGTGRKPQTHRQERRARALVRQQTRSRRRNRRGW